MPKYKILLVVPLYQPKESHLNLVEYLGFGYIASYLREKEFDVDIMDAYVENFTAEQICNSIRLNSYDLVAFTLMSSEYYKNVKEILNILGTDSKRTPYIIAGGYYATFNGYSILEQEKRINAVIIGEGEKTLFELVETLLCKGNIASVKGMLYLEDNVIKSTGHRHTFSEEELDKLPFPARDTLDIFHKTTGKREAQVLSSRGCYGNCSFCAVNTYYKMLEGKKWRARRAENVVDEIEILINNYNVEYINFTDEEFIGIGEKGKSRAKEIANLIKARKLNIKFYIFCRVDSIDYETIKVLCEAGLDRVFLGIEFGSQRLLNFYNKGVKVEDNIKALKVLRQFGIKVTVGYMMFEPTMDINDFKENIEFYYKYLPFRLKYLLRKLAIYANSEAHSKLAKLIEIESVLTFDAVAGDNFAYKFKDSKIAFLYKLLYECIPTISPSLRLEHIMKHESQKEKNIMIKDWTSDIYTIILQFVDKLEKETDVSDELYDMYSSELKKVLNDWDKPSSLAVATVI